MLFHNLRQYLLYQRCVHTSFYHSSGWTRKLMFNGSIYYILYLQILPFYFMGQKCWKQMRQNVRHKMLSYIINGLFGVCYLHRKKDKANSHYIPKTKELLINLLVSMATMMSRVTCLWIKKVKNTLSGVFTNCFLIGSLTNWLCWLQSTHPLNDVI